MYRAITLVSTLLNCLVRVHIDITNVIPTTCTEYKEAFALFDKRGTGAVSRETLGDLLRALGQNPTQAEVAEIVASAPRDGV
jgi:Ca2+-binding EF-hand superfamily protein